MWCYVIVMWLFCDVMWLLCDCYVIVMWCYVTAMWLLSDVMGLLCDCNIYFCKKSAKTLTSSKLKSPEINILKIILSIMTLLTSQ